MLHTTRKAAVKCRRAALLQNTIVAAPEAVRDGELIPSSQTHSSVKSGVNQAHPDREWIPESTGEQGGHHDSHAKARGWENSAGWLYGPDHEARLREYTRIVRPARTEQSCRD